jgi:hypothetical protein
MVASSADAMVLWPKNRANSVIPLLLILSVNIGRSADGDLEGHGTLQDDYVTASLSGELDAVQREFWEVPIARSDECNIETIECRARGVHWEAAPPAFILVALRGETQRAHNIITSCNTKQDKTLSAETGKVGDQRRFFVLTSASEEEARPLLSGGAFITFAAVNDASLSSPARTAPQALPPPPLSPCPSHPSFSLSLVSLLSRSLARSHSLALALAVYFMIVTTNTDTDVESLFPLDWIQHRGVEKC